MQNIVWLKVQANHLYNIFFLITSGDYDLYEFIFDYVFYLVLINELIYVYI